MIRYAYADVGKSGLCNMLYPWARAYCYAQETGCRMIAPTWTKFLRLGPVLRGERDSRLYLNQFTNRGYVTGLRKAFLLGLCRGSVEVFSGMAGGLRPIIDKAEIVKKELFRITNPRIMESVSCLPTRFIGVHVRRGDFSRIGFTLPDSYYVRAIREARRRMGQRTPALVFSDDNGDGLSFLRKLRDVCVMPPAPALQDMLSLSKATILVATNRSTFSGWANYLGGMPGLWSKDGELPSESIGLKTYELI